MLMSQSARSASVIGLPSPGASAATATPAATTKANETTSAKLLPIDMLGLPFAVDGPARDDVHVPHREGCHRNVDFGLPAFGEHLGAGRLHVASLVPGAALQDHRLAVPAPRHAEAGQRLGEHWRVERGLAPALAAIGRDHHPRNAAVARIGEAGNL